MNMATTKSLFTCFAILWVASALADEAGVNVPDAAKWPTDKVTLANGRTINGLVIYEGDDEVEILEVGWDPARKMYLTRWWLPRQRVGRIELLGQPQRRELEQNIARFHDRVRIAAAQINEIDLEHRRVPGIEYLYYQGPWFSLASTAEENLTREAIVRIEQVFAGFRTFIRPRKRPAQLPRIILLESLDQYFDYQRLGDRSIRNPAYFNPARNEIVAGGQLASFAEKRSEVRAHHEQLLARYEAQQETLRQTLQTLTHRLAAQGTDEDEIRKVRTAAERQWTKLVEQQELKIRLAEHENDKQYHEQFRVLYHEAFHAYLQNYVYDGEQFEVPRWLNEGLAQVFEAGMLDAGGLRLDVPNATALAALQRDLQAGAALPLAELLQADPRQFLVGHGDAARTSNRLYLYSWGVAHYLTFRLRLLDTEALDRYFKRTTGPDDRVERFEKLVNQPLDQFQRKWRQYMLELKSSVE